MWLALLSVLLVATLALLPGLDALESATLDLKHRAVFLTSRTSPPGAGSGANIHRLPPPRPALGANVFLEQEVESAKRQRSLDLLGDAGLGWVRQQLPWEQVEPVAKGHYEDPTFGGSTWSKFDDVVDRAAASGTKLLLRLDTSPRWALPANAPDGLGPPTRFEDYWDFAETVAARYRGRVAAYQVWNEPNLHIEWGQQPPDPAGYARLLSGAAARIRRADPDALVVMAALAPTLTQSAEAAEELGYLQRLYDEGIRGNFDVLAVQAYGLRGGPDDPRTGPTDVTFSRPSLVRNVMVRNGDAATPVWATEVGWNVNPGSFPIQRFGRVTPTLQARYTVRALEHAREAWPWMDAMFVWYWKRPDEQHRGEDWYWFRLADPDFQLQPVYYALADYQRARPRP